MKLKKTTIENLNIYCLIEIAKFLNLKDQISLFEVNTNFELAVAAVWRSKYQHVFINFFTACLTAEEFAVFAKTIKNFVKTLQLKFITKDKYAIIRQNCFEKVNYLSFSQRRPHFMEDNDLRELKENFPNLECLAVHGNFSGLYIDQWRTINDLKLNLCNSLQIEHFQNIMNHLRVEKLILTKFTNYNSYGHIDLVNAQTEHLKFLEVNSYESYFFLATPLPALKELIINYYNDIEFLLDGLLSIWQTKDIRLLQIASANSFLENCLERNLKVEELTIVNDNNPLTSNIISSLYRLTNLRKLCFGNCLIKTKDFNNLLNNIPQVNEIRFEYCHFDSAKIFIKVRQVVRKRNDKLKLNMSNNKLMEECFVNKMEWIQKNRDIYIRVAPIGSHDFFQFSQIERCNFWENRLRVVYR